jgi:predicted alpha/beta superfamily hydrolase
MTNLIKKLYRKSWLNYTACFFLMSSISQSYSQENDESAESNHKNLEPLLFRTETKILHSDLINENFEINISLPVDYLRSDTTYPVLFCTDANRNMGMITNIVNILSFPDNEIPRILVVGIGYSIKGLEDWGAKRNRDFTPTSDIDHDIKWKERLSVMSGRNDLIVTSGGALLFLNFIRDELIPFIESNYRVSSSDRAIMGYSHGGLFTLYALFHSSGTFQRYFAGSPSIWWDNTVIFKDEYEYAATHKDLPVKLFISVGSLEGKSTLENISKMAERLRSRNYPGLKLETHIFEDETHPSCYAGAISRALRVIYK